MPIPRQRLIVFTRYPVPGRAKTRLIPALGADGAAEVQRAMTVHVLDLARAVVARGDLTLEVRFDGAPRRWMRRWLGRLPDYREQGVGDMGERMERAFSEAFEQGAGRVVVIGTDCPSLNADLLMQAFDGLADADAVIGPAADGGYTLIGLRRPCPKLFKGIAWGTERVFTQTCRIASTEKLRVVRLPELQDVDRPEDLAAWDQCRRVSSGLAVIIPTLNESEYLERTLASVQVGRPEEVVVVEGGSSDGSGEIAVRMGCKVVRGVRGRATQMNAGAAASSAAQLLFLHADTLLPKDYRMWVEGVLGDPLHAGGAFRFAIREQVPWRGFLEGLVRLRCWLLRNPFGDQGLFLRRQLFEALGGFPNWPLLEDVEIVRQLKRWGRVAVVPARVQTSGRRWLTRGVWRTLWVNQRVMAGYYCGQSPETLAERYRKLRRAR